MTIVDVILASLPMIPVIIVQIKQARTATKDNKVILDSLKENYAQTGELKASLTKHIAESQFQQNLHGVIQTRAANLILTSQYETRYKTVMKSMAKKLESLAFRYYYSKYRGVEYEMKDFLTVEIDDIEASIKLQIKHEIPDIKKYKYDRGKVHTISFHDFYYDENTKTPNKYLRILGIVLEENGFDSGEEDAPDFIQTMDKYTKDILTSFMEEVKEWNKIKDIPIEEKIGG